jgi:hypothetical protein
LDYSRRTEKTYVTWIRRLIVFYGKRRPREMGAAEVTAFTNLSQTGQEPDNLLGRLTFYG